jgi:hypothetical protein
MNQLTIGIIHAPRKPDYIGLTISNLQEEFPGIDLHIFAEPGSEYFDGMDSVIIHQNPVTYGPLFNWLHAIQTLSSLAEWVMMCEDDIQWGKGQGLIFREYVLSCGPGVGMISGYCSKPNANPKSLGFGLAKISPYGWCGALSIAVPAYLVPKIISHAYVSQEWRGKHLDYVVGKVIKSLGLDIIVHTPTLVHHLGANSSTLLPPGHKNLFGYVRQAYDNSTLAHDLQ